MIRVLNVLSSLDGGGVEMILFNYYSHMDHSKTQFDFVVHNPNEGILEAPLKKMGSDIYHVTPKHTSLLRNIIEIDTIIKNGNYDIVQCHQNFSSFTTLLCARLRGVKVRVAHSHGNNPAKTLQSKLRYTFFRSLNRLGANYFFACGEGAGKWLFGKKWTTDSHSKIINNAIDTKRFAYDPRIRKRMRKEYSLKDEIVLLHVGRFSPEKNHKFMVELLEALQSQKPDTYTLFFAGAGTLEKEIEELVHSKQLTDRIHFLGNRKDIPELLNMSDIFLLPSVHEGFPVTLIEAQSTGIHVLASKSISRETKLTDRISYISVNDMQNWIIAIESYKAQGREGYSQMVKEHGFDILKESKKYQNHLMTIFAESKIR